MGAVQASRVQEAQSPKASLGNMSKPEAFLRSLCILQGRKTSPAAKTFFLKREQSRPRCLSILGRLKHSAGTGQITSPVAVEAEQCFSPCGSLQARSAKRPQALQMLPGLLGTCSAAHHELPV